MTYETWKDPLKDIANVYIPDHTRGHEHYPYSHNLHNGSKTMKTKLQYLNHRLTDNISYIIIFRKLDEIIQCMEVIWTPTRQSTADNGDAANPHYYSWIHKACFYLCSSLLTRSISCVNAPLLWCSHITVSLCQSKPPAFISRQNTPNKIFDSYSLKIFIASPSILWCVMSSSGPLTCFGSFVVLQWRGFEDVAAHI